MAHQLAAPNPVAPRRMTYDEFLAWATDHPHAEWVDGEAIEFMTVKGRRALAVVVLIKVIGGFVDHRRLALLVGNPYPLLLRGGWSSRQPDLAVLLNAHLDRFTEERLQGPADLVEDEIVPGIHDARACRARARRAPRTRPAP